MRLSRGLLVGRFAVPVVVLLLLPGAADAQAVYAPKAVPTAQREAHQILTYDVADLLLDVPDYPYPDTAKPSMPVMGGMGMGGGMFNVAVQAGMGGMGGMGMGMGGMGGSGGTARFGGTGVATVGSNPTRITVDEIVRMLVTVVAPDTWDGPGGGTVVPLGTSLVIRQTAAAHEQIDKLLAQLRAESCKRKTVAIDARWLLLDSDELERLAPPATADGPSALDRKALAEFTRRPSSLRGLTHCHTGQLVYLVSGTRRNVVSSFIPVVGSVDRPEETNRQLASYRGGARIFLTAGGASDGDEPGRVEAGRSVGYQPVIERPNFGVLLEIRPTLLSRGETATVDVRTTLTVPSPKSAGAAEPMPGSPLAPTVDRLSIETQELATTLSVPLGQPVVVGGMTYLGPSATTPVGEEAKAETPSAKETPQLYLVIELR